MMAERHALGLGTEAGDGGITGVSPRQSDGSTEQEHCPDCQRVIRNAEEGKVDNDDGHDHKPAAAASEKGSPVYKPARTMKELRDDHQEKQEIEDSLKQEQHEAGTDTNDSDGEDEDAELEIDDRMWEKLEKRRPPSITQLELAERIPVKRILMLYNPHSGRQRGERLAKRSLRLFHKLGIEVEQVMLKYPGHAERICSTLDVNVKKEKKEDKDHTHTEHPHFHKGSHESEAEITKELESSCSDSDLDQTKKKKKSPRRHDKFIDSSDPIPWDLVCAVGGDGTFHECVNGTMQRKAKKFPIIPLSLIAAGTGNSFMLELGLRDWKTAVYHIARGIHYPIDICELHFGDGGSTYAFNSIHWGMASRVLVRAERLRWMGSAIRYTTAAFVEIMNGKTQLARISARDAEDKLIEFDSPFSVGIANNIITASRGMKMAPDAKLDDGLIDLLLVTSHASLNLMSMFRRTYDGSHTDLPYVHYLQVKSFTITPYKVISEEKGNDAAEIEELEELLDVDGELKGCTPLSCVVLKQALRVIV